MLLQVYIINIFRGGVPSFSPAVNTTAWLHVTQRSAVRFRPTVNYSFRAFLFWFGGRPPSRDNHAQPHQTGAQRRIEPAELQVLISMPFSICPSQSRQPPRKVGSPPPCCTSVVSCLEK